MKTIFGASTSSNRLDVQWLWGAQMLPPTQEILMSVRKSIRKPWTVEEDRALVQLLAKYGPGGCWSEIATLMVTRTGKQCRERYLNHLDPTMKRTAWTTKEDNVIRSLFPSIGTKWSQYMPSLPGRSDNAIKNRYHIISRGGSVDLSRSDDTIESYSGVKRSAFEATPNESDNHVCPPISEPTTDATQERVKRLQTARELLDQRIRELKVITPFDMGSYSSPSSSSDLSTTLCEETIKSALGPEFGDLGFLWEERGAERKSHSKEDSDRKSTENDMLAPFDLSCYDVDT